MSVHWLLLVRKKAVNANRRKTMRAQQKMHRDTRREIDRNTIDLMQNAKANGHMPFAFAFVFMTGRSAW